MGGVQTRREVRNIRSGLHDPGARGVSGTAGPTQIHSGSANSMAEGRVSRSFGEGQGTSDGFGEGADCSQSGTLARSVKCIEWAGPFQSELTEGVAIAGPDRMGAFEEQIVIVRLARDI